MFNLKEKREQAGKTQIAMAILCNVSLSTYRLWEYGAAKPSPENLEKLKAVLGVK